MTHVNLSGRSILLADDVTYSRSAVLWLLKDFGEPTVTQAANGKEALGYLRGGVDLIISDFNMPEMHGLELLKAVRTGQHGIERATTFAMLTAYSDKHLVDTALALDVNAFLVKPVSKQALAERLDQMLGQGQFREWLKPVAMYEKAEVESALDHVAEASKAENEGAPAPSVFRGNAKAPLLRGATQAEKAGSRRKSAPIISAAYPDERLCSINEIPANAVLSRDLYTPNGRLFLKAGSALRPRIISLLTDLDRLRSPIENIWIADEE